MTVRFIHTADVHLDAPFAYLPADRRQLKRQALRDSFRRVIDLAIERGVDAVLVAGDLFDMPRPAADTVNFVRSEFQRLTDRGAAAFVVPGNHDFFDAQGVWGQTAFPANVHIFTADAWQAIEETSGVPVWGIACHRSGQERNALADLPPGNDGAIVLLHGSHQLDFYEGSHCYPFTVEHLSGVDAAYVALGHHHNFGQPDAKRPAYYSGSPEGLSFDEGGERRALLVTFEEDVKVEPLAVGKYLYASERLDCTTFASSEEVRQAIARLGNPDTLLRVTLTGTPPLTVDLDPDALAAGLDSQLFYFDIRGQVALPDDLGVGDERTVKGLFARRMAARLAAAGTDEERARVSLATRLGLAALEGRLK